MRTITMKKHQICKISPSNRHPSSQQNNVFAGFVLRRLPKPVASKEHSKNIAIEIERDADRVGERERERTQETRDCSHGSFERSGFFISDVLGLGYYRGIGNGA